jgi:O-antigen chain-terminating methyltransferase
LLERRIELGNQDVWIKLGVLSEQMIAREREILEQERRLVALLDQARQRASEGIPEPAPAIVARERAHLNDRHYFEFEERFRGTPDDISDRLRVYLPHVRQAAAVTAGAPVLDVGCGRGEWLELLRQEGLAAKGVDNNRTMVAELGARGLQATEADAIEFLRGLEPGSLGAITAFHVIEHLPFEQMLTLFAECWRALQPGGIAIFETPNPENLVVGACNFWCDPTHLRPLPPEPTRFALESRGFRDVAILRLHPAHNAPETNAPEGAFEQAVHDRLYGAQDYALIGYRR